MMKAHRCGYFSLIGFVALMVSLPSCRKPSSRVEMPPQRSSAVVPVEPVERQPETPSPVPDDDAAGEGTVYVEPGWVQVEVLRAKAEGGWATGDFHEARNKIQIQTRGVKQFSLDLSKLEINWDRLVVISIDGRNAELRKRDFDLLHIARNDHGKWVVQEP